MFPFRLARRSLIFHWRASAAVALGVMAATAVLTGALVVGDSMKGSLRHLVLDRLGRIDAALVTTHFFHESLVESLVKELADDPLTAQAYADAIPAIMLEGTLENPAGQHRHRAGSVTVLGIVPKFWQLGRGGPKNSPTGNEIVLNQPLADELRVHPGDEIILRLPQAAEVPADSPLGRKTETVRSRRFTVSEVIPPEGLGRFGLRPSQQLPLDAFAPLAALQQSLGVDEKANAILIMARERADKQNLPVAKSEARLQEYLFPAASDYGLSIRKTDRGYFNITSDRMVLEPAVADVVLKELTNLHPQPIFTYLANYIRTADSRGKIPYSTVVALDFTDQPPLGPLVNPQGQPIEPLADDEIVLNSWAADDLSAQGAPVHPGDTIELTYFEPESTHGRVVETSHRFKLKDIAEFSGPAEDRDFTPEVKGVTDEASIADWNPPFPFDSSRVRSTPPHNEDDRYWREHRATPKAFVSLSTGRRLWSSRFGNTTSIRISPTGQATEKTLAQKIEKLLNSTKPGFQFLPVKRLSLAAANGTTPFSVLFLLFSAFIIVAALLLIALLFKLGVETRAAELGIILAVGLRHSLARRILLIEGVFVAIIGSLAGAVVGVLYAWLMLLGLRTWWLGAISTPFLDLYVDGHSIVYGFLIGVLVSLATIAWSLRRIRRTSARRLLAGQVEEQSVFVARKSRWPRWLAVGMFLAAIIAVFAATGLTDEAQAGAFLGAGLLILAALLTWLWNRMRHDSTAGQISGRAALARLAARNAARFPLRSTLTIGLMASACFLIVAVSAFELAAPSSGPACASGDGGFAYVAQSDQPIYQDLNTTDGRRELGFDDQAQAALFDGKSRTADIFALRVQAGDDASCLNLYQPRQPRILGMPQSFIDRGGFAWSARLAGAENPWKLLEPSPSGRGQGEGADAIPVVLDENTALYSLHLYGGAGETFEIDNPRGGKIQLKVVGLLKNSIFQGDLLISEENFQRLFPDTSGYRFFLIDVFVNQAPQVVEALETSLSDYGFAAQSTAVRLAGFFEVQNTYLAAFRSLGGLGLLLGTFGLAAVQLRSIVQRRGELALMRAAGFRRRRLAQLVMLENASLLIAGLTIGVIAALVTLLPHLLAGGASIPWLSLAATLAVVLCAGLLAGLASVRAALRAPLLAALRGK
jgi:putative ABC transport system permease protein